MPNDAKLGLVVGVGLVIAVAVLFFRKDTPYGTPSGDPAPAGIVRPFPLPPPMLPAEQRQPVRRPCQPSHRRRSPGRIGIRCAKVTRCSAWRDSIMGMRSDLAPSTRPIETSCERRIHCRSARNWSFQMLRRKRIHSHMAVSGAPDSEYCRRWYEAPEG